MAITVYNPNRPQERQFEIVMQMLMNLGMQKRQLAARKEEADIANTRMEAREKANRMWLDNREARQRGEEAKIAVRKQRGSMAKQLHERGVEREERAQVRKQYPQAAFYKGNVIRPQQKPQGQALKTWVDRKGRLHHLSPGTQPPPGSKPWTKPTGKETKDKLNIWKVAPDGRTITMQVGKAEAGRYATEVDRAGRPVWHRGKPGAVPKKTAMTKDQVFKTIRDLESHKLRVQSTKGVDPLMLFMMRDNPEAQAAYKAGNTAPAIAEFDRQLAYYRGMLKEELPPGLTEEDIAYYEKNSGYSREKTISLYRSARGL